MLMKKEDFSQAPRRTIMFNFKQTDKEFPSDIQHFGCLFFSNLYLLNKHFNKEWPTAQSVIDTYNSEENDEDLGKECFVNDPQKLIDSIIGPNKVLYLGHKDASYACAANEYEIQAWYNARTSFTHFVVGDCKGIARSNVEYDPIRGGDGGGSITVKEGVCQSKRVFRKLV
jgi:hypothetical protein